MEPAFVSVDEAASFLGLPRSTVYGLIDRDEFPVSFTRMGKRILVNRASLLALAESADRSASRSASSVVSVVGRRSKHAGDAA